MNEQTLRMFLRNLHEQCNGHADWLTYMRFGMGTLLQHPALLIEEVFAEAQRMSTNQGGSGPLHEAKRVLGELNLTLTAA